MIQPGEQYKVTTATPNHDGGIFGPRWLRSTDHIDPCPKWARELAGSE